MTPAEHHQIAEELLSAARDDVDGAGRTVLVGVAHVHATLALSGQAGPPATAGRPKVDVRRPVVGEDVSGEKLTVTLLRHGLSLASDDGSRWATVLDDPAHVRRLAEYLTVAADAMDKRAAEQARP